MTHYTKRCKHCKISYTYQGSGHGCNRATNDKVYCPTCSAAIIQALDKVAIKVEKRYMLCNDYTLEESLNLVKVYEDSEKKKNEGTPFGGLFFRRVLAGKVDTKDPSNRNSVEFFKHDSKEYVLSYWSKTQEFTLKVAKEFDLSPGEDLGYW